MGQQALAIGGAVAGAVIGTFAGNPFLGAEIGFTLGSLAGGVLFPQKLSGPRTPNLQVQSGSYGAMLPIAYGNARVPGAVIWAAPIHEVGTQQGGKGSPQVTSFAYYGYFAVALCEGPILGIRRIWANGILVYDVSSTATPATLQASNTFFGSYCTLYLGDLVQNPDPTMQSYLGAGNVPAYRGTAYLVLRGLPLQNYANVLPSMNVEAVTSGLTLTPAKVWENDSTGWGMGAGGFVGNGYPFVSAIGGGLVRVLGRLTSSYGVVPNVFRAALADGTVESQDSPTTFENGINSNAGGSYAFVDASSNPVGLVCPHGQSSATRGAGVFTNSIYNAAITLSPQRSALSPAANLQVYDTFLPGVIGDVIAALVQPAGVTGTWKTMSSMPCADWQHVGVVTFDSGSGNYWFHVVAFGIDGNCTELAHYLYTLTADGVASSGFIMSWTDVTFHAANVAMMESTLTSFWTFDGSLGTATSRYFKLNAAGQMAQAGVAGYSATIGTGYGSMFSDNGVAVIVEAPGQIFCVVASQLGAIATIPLSTIVTDLAERSGLASGQINATALTDGVWGFVIDRQMAARAAFEAIMPAFWFDAVESDGLLKFVHRSATSSGTIPLGDLVVNGSSATAPLQFVRASEIELPSQLNLTYSAVSANYQPGLQYARRLIGIESNNVQTIDAAAVMDDTQAAVAAAIIMWDTVAGRVSFKFPTTYEWAQYEPTDIVTLQTLTESYLVRITRKTEGAGKIDWEASGCAPVYSQSANGGAIVAGQDVNGVIPTSALILDIPPLRDQDGAYPYLYVAMYGSGAGTWPGGGIFKSSDGGATYVAGPTLGTASTVGRAETVLGTWGGSNMFDEANTVDVTILSGQTLASASELTVLNGGNVALLGNEIIQFKNAVLVTGSKYRLSGLLRGRIATEDGIAGHGVGDKFVLLSAPGILAISQTPSSDIGQPRIYDAVTIGQPLSTGQQQTITEAGETLVCFSPVHLFAWADAAHNINLRWVRRNRIAWQWLSGADEPMSEASEAYVVTIFNGSTPVRTINVSGVGVQSAQYTSAQQTTDFGGTQSSLTWGVQQISAVTGAGDMAKLSGSVPGTVTMQSKILTATQGSVATLRAGRMLRRVLTATQGSAATLAKGSVVKKALSATQGTTATLAELQIVASAALLHCDGTDGSTSFPDVYSNTWTAHGSAAVRTAQAKFGTASMGLGATAGSCITSPDSSAFNPGSGNCTYEAFVYLNSYGTTQELLFYKGSGSFQGVLLGILTSTGNPFLLVGTGGTWSINTVGTWSLGAVPLNAWTHLVACRNGNQWDLYMGGTSGVNQNAGGITVYNDGTVQQVGGSSTLGAYQVDGYMDEIRISKVARYTGNFTPPSSPFTY